MEKRNKQDIVDQIIEQLKAAEDLPYKEGAWEKFQETHNPSAIKKNRAYYWAASAAAVLLVGAFAIQQYSKDKLPTNDPNQTIVMQDPANSSSTQQNTNEGIDQNSITEEVPTSLNPGVITNANEQQVIAQVNATNQGIIANQSSTSLNGMFEAQTGMHAITSNVANPKYIELKNPVITTQISSLKNDNELKPIWDSRIVSTLASSNQQLGKSAISGQEPQFQNKRFNFGERFDLGVFVSPNSTNDKFNFGGGVLVAYNVTKNIAVRTGLAFNRYEAGAMRDPIANQDIPVAASKETIQKYNQNSFLQANVSNAVILPNINAISGAVQAIEIPVDVKLKTNSGFYASTGLTYSAVTKQERFTHYIENSNSEVFPDGMPADDKGVEKAVKQVSRSIKTEEPNVSTNGFGGFMNLSIGKEVKMKKSFSISVEPYLKLPVGNFKRADMNYTNGGLRIITNF